MGLDYSEIGLGDGLLKPVEGVLQKINPDIQIEDGAIQGIKLMTKSVSLDKLYGQDLQIGGNSNISGSIIALNGAGEPRVTIDAIDGLSVIDNSNRNVFQATIAGSNPGSVQIGTYDGSTGTGAFYDNSGGSFKISGSITAGSIQIGSNFQVTNAGIMTASNGIFQGQITAGSGTIGGWTINPSTLSHGSITLDAGNSKISGGTIEGSTIILNQSTPSGGSTSAFLRWTGNSRIWSDTSNNMGINSIGTGGMYIYTDSTQRIFIGSSNINLYPNTTYLHEINFAFDSQTEGNIYNVDIIKGKDDVRFQAPSDDFKFLDNGGNTVATISHLNGHFASDSPHLYLNTNDLYLTGGAGFQINGHIKSAIVPTSKGYRALYCMESPEVWFMDFCAGKKMFLHRGWKFWKWGFDYEAKPDPMFMEVTVPPYVIMPTATKGIVQVWGKRKGHEKKRFEEKTKAEFNKNEEFLQQAELTKK